MDTVVVLWIVPSVKRQKTDLLLSGPQSLSGMKVLVFIWKSVSQSVLISLSCRAVEMPTVSKVSIPAFTIKVLDWQTN